MMNTAPVSTEELLTKSTKKASLSPEDDTVFVEKNTSQLGYERVWQNRARFNIESNGNMNTIEIQHDSYGMRAQTAFLYLVFNIKLKGNNADNACPANMFPLVSFNNFRMRLGLNQAEIVSPNDHYIYKFLSILNSNYSKQDKVNILSAMGCFPEFDLTQVKFRQLLAKAMGFQFNAIAISEQERRVGFVVPLSLLHGMFNHETILPVGTRIDFNFTVDQGGNKNAIVSPDATRTGTYEFLVRESFLYCEYPERDPSILLAQLENREYVSEGLNYETSRSEIPSGSTFMSIPLLRPGSKLPVKIDFGFIPSTALDDNKDIFQFKGAGLSRVEVIYNGPFPAQYVLETVSGKGMEDINPTSANSPAMLDKFTVYQEFFNQTDTFLLDTYGSSYNNESTLDPMLRINYLLPWLQKDPYVLFDPDNLVALAGVHNNRQVFTTILMPSKMLNGTAYPTVEGALTLNLRFEKPTVVDHVMFVNLYYFQELRLTENFQCNVTNITLENFHPSADRPADPVSDLPFPTNVREELPTGEADNVVDNA